MYPKRVGGIAATCAEAFRPYNPVLANLTGVCYWWGWVPTCGLTAIFSGCRDPRMVSARCAGARHIVRAGAVLRGGQSVRSQMGRQARDSDRDRVRGACVHFSARSDCWPGEVDWQQATTFHLTVPFEGWFGELTGFMAGLYLIGFAAPAFEAAACHVGETVDPNKNVPRAMFASAVDGVALFHRAADRLARRTGARAIGQGPHAGAGTDVRAGLRQLRQGGRHLVHDVQHVSRHAAAACRCGADDVAARRGRTAAAHAGAKDRAPTCPGWPPALTAGMAIFFLLLGDPIWLVAAANFTYLIGICLPNVAVWLLRRNQPDAQRPYRAPRGMIVLGLVAAAVWTISAVLGFQQFGMKTVLVGVLFAYSGSVLYAWRRFSDRRRAGLARRGQHAAHQAHRRDAARARVRRRRLPACSDQPARSEQRARQRAGGHLRRRRHPEHQRRPGAARHPRPRHGAGIATPRPPWRRGQWRASRMRCWRLGAATWTPLTRASTWCR